MLLSSVEDKRPSILGLLDKSLCALTSPLKINMGRVHVELGAKPLISIRDNRFGENISYLFFAWNEQNL